MHRRLPDVAREFLQRGGTRLTGEEYDNDVVRMALAQPHFVQRASDGTSYHTSGSFSNLLLDAANKTLRDAYDEAPASYESWTSRGMEAPDYKELHRIIFGDMGLVSQVPEGDDYPEMSSTDSRESYRVRKHGGIFSITLEMVVNDDVNGMRVIQRRQGAGMRRTINRDVYSVLTENNALTDGITLFHSSSHGGNLDATALAAGAPLDVGFQIMASQSGTDSTSVLGLAPRFLIVPMALSATALQITSDMFQPQTAANSNLYGGRGPRNLEVIADGQIDNLGTASNWWLAADPRDVDTVEITFLQGESTPQLSREDGFSTDTIKYKVRQSYGVKALDYRGLYQGNS